MDLTRRDLLRTLAALPLAWVGLPHVRARATTAGTYDLLPDSFLLVVSPSNYLSAIAGGPVAELPYSDGTHMAIDPGTRVRYLSLHASRQVARIEANGLFEIIAGTGVAGIRDGDGRFAMFAWGSRGGYFYETIALAPDGSLIVPDAERIRRIQQLPDGLWWVDTIAGGGTVTLKAGQSTDQPTNADFAGMHPVAAVADPSGVIWWEAGPLYELRPEGTLHAHQIVTDADIGLVSVVDMACDAAGTLYALTRRLKYGQVWRVDPDGLFSRIAGITDAEAYTRRQAGLRVPVDGLALEASFHAPAYLAVEVDGSALYCGGGNEVQLRRIKDGRVASLISDGTWVELPVRSDPRSLEIGGPRGIDPEGRIYVAKRYFELPFPGQRTWIQRLDPAGV
jgi:hypothetical protein